MKKLILLLLPLSLFLSNCQNFSLLPKEEESTSQNTTGVKNGLIKNYRNDGSLHSEIEYENNIKHGLAKSYSNTGKLQLEIMYDHGKRNGLSTTYYESGKVRRTIQYVNDKKQGQKIDYYENGNLSSSISYFEDMPANDLKEYLKSGKEKSLYPILTATGIDHTKFEDEYIIKVSFSENSARADYYVGELVKGKYFDESKSSKMVRNKEGGFLIYKLPSGSFLMEKVNIIGVLKTAKSNELIRATAFNLAIEN